MRVRWFRIGLWAAVALLALAVAAAALWESGVAERWARAALIRRVETATGGRVELGGFRLSLLPLRVELDRFTIHGREAAGEPPFVRIERVTVGVGWRALLEGKVVLGSVALDRPAVYIRIDRAGQSNVPAPAHARPSRPWHERLFSITIDHLRLVDGDIRFNDRRIPLSAAGGRFAFRMDYAAPQAGRDFYQGQLGWEGMEIAAQKWVPFPSTWSAKFTIGRRGGSLDRFVWVLPHSSIEARADWPDWAERQFEAHYRVRLNLTDIHTLLRKPHTPSGIVESTGDLRYSSDGWNLRGYYSARDIGMAYKWYHAANMSSRGTLLADPRSLEIPDFQAWALGGEFTGRVRMDTRTLDFTTTTQSHKVRLADLLAAVRNADFPVETLHWDADVDVDSVTTWHADFRDMATRGRMTWTPLPDTPAGEMPATAAVVFDYLMSRNTVFAQGAIDTPQTRLNLKGTIADRASNMSVNVTAGDLRDWDDLINVLRGPSAAPALVTGRAAWQGTVTGPVSHPLFSGLVHAWQAGYDQLHWDEISGQVAYSSVGLTLNDMDVRRGRSSATGSLQLAFTNWAFLPESEWSVRAQLTRADTADLQALAGTRYPARAFLSGQFQGGGTRSQPELSGAFELDDLRTGGYAFARAAGRLEMNPGLVRVSAVTATFGSGRLGGELTYRRSDGQVQFDVFGTQLPLDQIPQIQTPSLPLAGRLDFRLTGNGPPEAPPGQGTVTISSLRAGGEPVGDLTGEVNSDGKRLRVGLETSLVKGKLSGALSLQLAGSDPIEGQLAAQGIDLDPFIEAGLHLKAITGQSSVDGRFRLSGELLHPQTIAVDADVSRLAFAFETVKLENSGPIRLVYRKSDVTVVQAELKGPDSNFQLSGEVRFNRDQPLDLRVLGTVNLKLAEGFVPSLVSSGSAQVDAAFFGTFGQPRISGRARLANASLTYADIPVGLNAVNGDLVFSSDHVSFANVQAEAGGGSLVLDGAVAFPSGLSQAQYDFRIRASNVRVRWPAGMSWRVNATVQMAGTTQGATLGGQITLDRLLLTNGPEAPALLLMAPQEAAVESETTSPFLRNLRLDFAINSGAGSLLEWTGARIGMDASLSVRGTWSRPAVLGHVHLLSGQVNYRGNRYLLSRGDLNFANPLQLDPVMNVEATTTIQQYEITVDLTGRASSLRLSYRSDPPLPETDVISLLALGYTGQASELRTTGTSNQFGATALLSQAVSSEVGGRIARLFGISRFSVEPFPTGAGIEPNAAARITIQQQLTPNLTLTYATNANSNSQQVIQIEYAVSRDVSIVALRDINGTFGINVEFKKRFR